MLSIIVTMSNMNIVCLQCNVTFSNQGNLRRHQRNVHSQDIRIGNQECGVCNEKCTTIVDLHKHIQEVHPDIKLQFHEKVFYCQSDFDQWKAEIERETTSSLKILNRKTSEDLVVLQYRCHRSGFPVVKAASERKRHGKLSGSIKTGITCPAMMKVTKQNQDEATQICVKYQSTHVGHKCEVDKLRLQKQDRCNLAGMLSAGIHTSVIVHKTREQYSPTRRLGHITRQDIYNIARDFKVNDAARKDDATALGIVRKMMSEQYNPVLVYEVGIPSSNTSANESSLIIDLSEKEISQNEEKSVILEQLHKKPRMDLNHEKSVLGDYWQSISRKIETFEDLTYVKEHLKSIDVYLDSTKTSELQTEKVKTIPSNKKVNPQQKFIIVRKNKNLK